ncbi:flippase [Acaryochloris marina]|uniref:flippase n=1 Tax=Acaryochloris marina TaxID=155978 RepID=UPI001BB060BC|nr:flippase [Acaryochloris marina]QUY44996.1 flippase [Acaryochloris marina S15]
MNLLVYFKGHFNHIFNNHFLFIKNNHLFRGITTTFGLKISSTGLGLLTNILLARLLGKAGLGIYIYALAWVNLLVVPSTLGFRKLMVREVAVCKTKSLWGEFNGLVKWTNSFTFFLSCAIALIVFFVSSVIGGETSKTIHSALAIALFLLPIKSLTIIRASILQGLDKIVKSQLPELLFAPILSLIFIGIAYLFSGIKVSVDFILILRVTAFYIAFYIGSQWLKQSLPSLVKQAQPKYYPQKWLSAAIPLMFLEGMRTIHHQTDALMLGAMQGPEAVGLYSVLSKGVMLVVFILGAVDTALSPLIAKLYTLGDINKLQKIVTKSSRIVFIVSSLITLVFLFFGHWFLLLFGQEFVEGRTALNILCIGKMLGALTTSSTFLLTMTGHERHVMVSAIVSSSLNLVLNFFFIPKWGIEGAALATTISNVFLHYWNGFSVWKTTHVNPTPFVLEAK